MHSALYTASIIIRFIVPDLSYLVFPIRSYFTALANGQTLPVKKRLEPPSEKNGITAGLLEMMLRQVDQEEGGGGCSESGGDDIETKKVLKMWGDIGLPRLL